ncbi:MAG: protein translocase subunit SecD [Actinobacteria bacterium]|nr:protein translocase subunit SecD [Actinomycetota bacterium]
MRRNLWYLILTFTIIGGTFVATLTSGSRPILGLDLQGGIEVRLAPVGVGYSDSSLDKAVDVIRNRVDGLGVAETETKRDGDQIVVALPGVRDRDKARRLVGKTAELRFRPVLGLVPPKGSTTTTTAPGGSTTTTALGATTTTTIAEVPTTPREQDEADATVVLPALRTGDESPLRYQLGPAALTGKGVKTARAQFQSGPGWGVTLELNGDGLAKFNQLANASYGKPTPTDQVAIVLDGVVQSAPAFQEPTFTSSGVSITGDFSESEAKDLATVLRFGALPVQLERLTTQSISPTLGDEQLRAGIAAGIIGLALVALYMLAFYRVLGLVVIAGLALVGMTLFTLVAFLGQSIGLTLTLAGVTGVIVSVGVTVDSYVVYFERLKDEVRTGRTVRSSVDRGFQRSIRTILAADVVSLIGALVLYWLAIGSVRQFAFLLGLSTLLDLILSVTFMHPVVFFMARRQGLVRAGKVGIAAGLDAREVTI